jgi:hypothetical protein
MGGSAVRTDLCFLVPRKDMSSRMECALLFTKQKGER